MKYHKIGGLHWFTIGRLRLMFCWVHKYETNVKMPKAKTLNDIIEQNDNIAEDNRREAIKSHPLLTWTPDEHNHFIF